MLKLMIQRVLSIDSPLFVTEDLLTRISDLNELFPRQRLLALEIGCGIGDFILQRARQQPEVNFLAIDIYNQGCLKTCRRLERAGLDNVRVMRIEARYLLAHFGRAGLFSSIYINCPDPWPKKRHRKRRLVNSEFLLTLHYALGAEGDLYFSSDVADYAEQVAGQLTKIPGFDPGLEVPVASAFPDYPLSKYMRRFLDQGHPLYFIHARRNPAQTLAASDLPPVRPGFRVRWGLAGNE
jgi:tRNA (guanine-N7-)-methyltransferase